MAYGLALASILFLFIALQLGWWSWRRLVARETLQRERRTFESWREAPMDEGGAADGKDSA